VVADLRLRTVVEVPFAGMAIHAPRSHDQARRTRSLPSPGITRHHLRSRRRRARAPIDVMPPEARHRSHARRLSAVFELVEQVDAGVSRRAPDRYSAGSTCSTSASSGFALAHANRRMRCPVPGVQAVG